MVQGGIRESGFIIIIIIINIAVSKYIWISGFVCYVYESSLFCQSCFTISNVHKDLCEFDFQWSYNLIKVQFAQH